MMRKNKLYTVNPWNRNLFVIGGQTNNVSSATNWSPGNTFTVQPQNYVKGMDFTTNYNNVGQKFNAIVDSGKNGLGNWKNVGGGSNSGSGGGNPGIENVDKLGTAMGIANSAAGAFTGIQTAYSGNRPQYSADAQNGFAQLDTLLTGGKKSKLGTGLVNAGAAVMNRGGMLFHGLGALAAGVLGTAGTIINNGWGYEVENEDAVRENTGRLKNLNFNAVNTDDLVDQFNQAGIRKVGLGEVSNGLFTNEGTRQAEELNRQQNEAYEYALSSFRNAGRNIDRDLYEDYMRNYAAYGGPLDTSNFGGALGLMQQNQYIDAINNRSNAIAKANTMQAPTFSFNKFDDGGFVDGFMQDPIAAAMNYIRQKDAEEAQAEAQAAQEAREQDYADMQTRLMNAETQNQGLQALLEDQGRSIASLQEAQALQASATPQTTNWQEPMMEAAREVVRNNGGAGSLKDYIKKSEKFSPTAYQLEGEAHPTIGYGFYNVYPGTNRKVKKGDVLSQAEADRYLDVAIQERADNLAKKVPNWNKLTSNQQDALIDLAFNAGDNARHFRKGSKLMTALANEDWDAASKQLATTSKNPNFKRGMQNRSNRRRNMFVNGDYSIKAFGGELGTNGTDWFNGLLQVNAGNTHERNPFGGVPLGVDSQGVPNLVEEGETVFNDYVFSKRLKVPNFMLKDLGLGGAMQKGKKHRMSFADVSKKLAEESEMRPNDPISMNGLNASLSKLMEIQEAERMKQQAKMQNEVYDNGLVAACGGHLKKYGHGGNILDGKHGKSRLNTYSYDPIETFKYWDKDAEDYDEGYRDFIENKLNNDWINRVMKGQYGDMSRYKGANNFNPTVEEAWQLGLDRKNSDWHKAMAAAYDEYKAGIDPITGKIVPSSTNAAKIAFPEITPKNPETISILPPSTAASDVSEEDGENRGLLSRVFGRDKNGNYQTWMRYAPAVGAGIFALTDALGITNKPDYTYADKLEAAANKAGYAPNIQAPYIGDYMRYTPFDRLFYANQLQANARATDRALMNNSGANRGTAAAGLLANAYNTNNNLGNLYRQAEEYNRAQYERTKEFNRRTNMFNAQMGLEADLANARYRQQASQMGLSGLAQAAAMREQIDNRVGAARSANITNLLNNLGNIGRENFALNQINNDRSSRYGARANGSSFYKPEEARKRNRKNGKNS